MTLAVITGLGSGALHAVTGPDHVLSLTPLAISERRSALRLGMLWGVGHAVGTLVLATLLTVLSTQIALEVLSSASERLAGLALVGMGAFSLYTLGRRGARAAASRARAGSVLTIGLVHGLTGAAALLLLLPAVFASEHVTRVLYLLGFAVGSTAAMAGLTWLVAQAARRAFQGGRVVKRLQGGAAVLSVLFGMTLLAL